MNHRYCIMKNVYFLFFCLALQLCFFVQSGYSQPSDKVLKIAIIPHRSNLGNEHAYSKLFRELTNETGIKFKWLGSKTYDDVIKKIQTGHADIGYVGPFSYVVAQDNFGVKILCRTFSSGKEEFYHSMIITRKDSGIQSLQDLKGKRFSFTDPQSTSGYLFPLAQLMASGVSEKDFSEVKFLKRHANSLIAIYKGHVDAGATSVTAIDKVAIKMDELEVLWKSEPIYRGLWVARKDLDVELFNKLQHAMLKMSYSPKSEAIFNELTTKGFVTGKDSDYDNVREVVKSMQRK